MMARVGAAVSVALMGAVVAFQVALILGAPWGAATQGGRAGGVLDAPGRVLAAVSVLILGSFALALLGRVGWGPWRGRRRLATVLGWIAVGYGVPAVVLNAATTSALERSIWLPVSAVLLVAQVVTMLGSRRAPAPDAVRS